jgi:hypothetical protein
LSGFVPVIVFFCPGFVLNFLSDFHFKAEFKTTVRFSGKPGDTKSGTGTVAANHGEEIRTMRRLAFPWPALLSGTIPNFLPATASRFTHRFWRRAINIVNENPRASGPGILH